MVTGRVKFYDAENLHVVGLWRRPSGRQRMQVLLIALIAVVALLVIAGASVLVRRERNQPNTPITHEQALRELRRARRESHYRSHYDPADTCCPVNQDALNSGGHTNY